jgi:prevent-host-death family protein
MVQQIIGVRDLFKGFKDVLQVVAKGGEYVIVRHSKPVCKITPYFDTEEALDRIQPKDKLHREIIEGHRQYLRGNYYTQEQVEQMMRHKK